MFDLLISCRVPHKISPWNVRQPQCTSLSFSFFTHQHLTKFGTIFEIPTNEFQRPVATLPVSQTIPHTRQIESQEPASNILQKCRQKPPERSLRASKPVPPSLMSLRASTPFTSTREYVDSRNIQLSGNRDTDHGYSSTVSHSRSEHQEPSRRLRHSQPSLWYVRNNSVGEAAWGKQRMRDRRLDLE